MKINREDLLMILFLIVAVIATILIVKPYTEGVGVYSNIGIQNVEEVLNELN